MTNCPNCSKVAEELMMVVDMRHDEAEALKTAMANAGIFDPQITDFADDGTVFDFATQYFQSQRTIYPTRKEVFYHAE